VSSDVLLPVAITLALGVPIVLVLWRVFVVGGDLRRDAQIGRLALDIVRRTDVSLGELAVVVDDLRRRRAEPIAIEASMHASIDALRRYAQEATVVDMHVTGSASGALRPEIERAQRAVELIEHGRRLMLDGAAAGAGRGRDFGQARLPEHDPRPRCHKGEGRGNRRGRRPGRHRGPLASSQPLTRMAGRAAPGQRRGR